MKNLIANTNITQHQYIRAKLLDSPLFFTRYFFKHQYNRKFVVGEHHKEICKIIKKIFLGEKTRVIINMPPRYGKTELLVKTLISMGLALNPKSKFIHTSYSETLALDNSEIVKDLIESEEYQKFFNVILKKDSKSKRKWYTDQGGGIYATGSGGQITGFGAGQVESDEEKDLNSFVNDIDKMSEAFNGAIIIDDPIKPEDANSPNMLEKINQRFDNTIRSRTNSRNTPIIIVMQRVSKEDLTGYLKDIEPDKWDILEMPAISEDNKPLWEFKHTLKELLELRKANEQVFETQYQQDPRDFKGKLFLPNDIQRFKLSELNLQNVSTKIGFIDVANQGTDKLCFPIGYIINDICYVVDVLFSGEDMRYTVPAAAAKINQHNMNMVVVETNSFGISFYNDLNDMVNIDIQALHQSSNKHKRIVGEAYNIKKYLAFRDDYEHGSEYDLYMREIFNYTKDGKAPQDDAPDATTGLSLLKREIESS